MKNPFARLISKPFWKEEEDCILPMRTHDHDHRCQNTKVGTSPIPLPVLSPTGTSLFHKLSHGGNTATQITRVFRYFLDTILADQATRRILFFLALNLSFTFVEICYGYYANSLSLMGDGLHMLFDSSAIVLNLVAAVVSKWPASNQFSFGYQDST